MKSRHMVSICMVVVAALLLVAALKNDALAEEKYIPLIVTDLRPEWNYDILGSYWVFEDVDTSFTGDPFKKAADRASDKMVAYAKSINADIVIGLRMEMSNFSGNYVGKLLMYGTCVRLKASAPPEPKSQAGTAKPK